ncbi:hypothetical protein DDZ13_08400 [Coraliomargarita sinensis]|uniref:Sialate O-acetylesterase domain-containing protein n=2 Tax=Coraliomargarita sinensis TaxID=2174842 RepID=A0A317ZL10_9BACT|nr:hypothetical protein DDZ13_08400 [Coraliomargarita sinensis]
MFIPALNAEEAPVKVYILSGQSNMVGIGQFTGGSQGWKEEFTDLTISTYPGSYDASLDYDAAEPSEVFEFESLKALRESEFPKEGVIVLRGFIEMPETGIYEFKSGWADATYGIMRIGDEVAYRKEPGEEEPTITPTKLKAGEKVPFRIIYFGHGPITGWYFRLDLPGTLKTVVLQEGKFPYLINDANEFVPRDDVWYRGEVTAKGNQWLNYGCGAGKTSIGPELGFGHMVGNYHDEPVLLLKTSQGNRSLGWDFLPPGSERFEVTDEEGKTWVYAGYKDSPSRWEKGTEPEAINWYAGKQYDDCFNAAKAVLANFDEEFPHWAGRGYEIAGFGWWQGHKDGGERGEGEAGVHAQRYEENLVTLINALRNEFNAPGAPFVVATCGFNGGEGWQPGSSADTIFKAQMAVSDPVKYPEFGGTVFTADTRPFYRPPEESPRNQSFHYHGNAETYMLVGEAMGRAMVRLKE